MILVNIAAGRASGLFSKVGITGSSRWVQLA
jgi:hypothetical protein